MCPFLLNQIINAVVDFDTKTNFLEALREAADQAENEIWTDVFEYFEKILKSEPEGFSASEEKDTE